MKRVSGFTLIELMIVVAVIAILSAIAVPAYLRYGYRARRPDGQQLLLTIANAEERYYSTNNQYTKDVTELGYPSSPAVSEKGYYQVTVTTADSGQTYTATAAPTPGDSQVGDACGDLSITNTGDKQPDSTKTSANSNGSCW